MSANAIEARPPAAALDQRIGGAYATELAKLTAQLVTRLLLLVCLVGPFAFAVLLKIQSGTPSDALFGADVHSSGFAISLVVLGFAGSWGFPLIAGLLAGDLLSSEDRHNTWKTILTRSVSLGELYTGKALAAATLAVALLLVATASSLIAGIVFVGAHGLVGLSGQLMPSGRTLLLTIVCWLYCLLPLLAYVSLGLLFSAATRNGIVGVLGPIVVALLTQLIDLIGRGAWVHLLLVGTSFTSFYGLFTTNQFFGPMLVSGLVSIAWIVACLSSAWLLLRRRDFLTGAAGRAPRWHAPLRVVAIATVIVAALAVTSNLGPVGVSKDRLQTSVATVFGNASLLQQSIIGRHVPAGAELYVKPYCNRRGTASRGPGDWQCTVNVFLPQPKTVPYQRTQVEYDVSVASDGCYKAQSPPTFVGGQTMLDAAGRSVTNPLFVVYGCLDPL